MTTTSTGTTASSAVSGASAAQALTAQASKAPASTKPGGELGKDAFLKLLVAQMKYQDPMNPAQGADYIAQTAQFTVVEKLEELSSTAKTGNTMSSTLMAATMLGREVTYIGDDGNDHTGIVTGARMESGVGVLNVGGKSVPIETVREVRAAGTTSVKAASSTSTASSAANGTTGAATA